MEPTTPILSSSLPTKEKELLFGHPFSDPIESMPSNQIMANSYPDPGTETSHSSIVLRMSVFSGKLVNTVSPLSLFKPITDSSWEWTPISEGPSPDSQLVWRIMLILGVCLELAIKLPWEHQMETTSPDATTAGSEEPILTLPSFIWVLLMSLTPSGSPSDSQMESGSSRQILENTWLDVTTALERVFLTLVSFTRLTLPIHGHNGLCNDRSLNSILSLLTFMSHYTKIKSNLFLKERMIEPLNLSLEIGNNSQITITAPFIYHTIKDIIRLCFSPDLFFKHYVRIVIIKER